MFSEISKQDLVMCVHSQCLWSIDSTAPVEMHSVIDLGSLQSALIKNQGQAGLC